MPFALTLCQHRGLTVRGSCSESGTERLGIASADGAIQGRGGAWPLALAGPSVASRICRNRRTWWSVGLHQVRMQWLPGAPANRDTMGFLKKPAPAESAVAGWWSRFFGLQPRVEKRSGALHPV